MIHDGGALSVNYSTIMPHNDDTHTKRIFPFPELILVKKTLGCSLTTVY